MLENVWSQSWCLYEKYHFLYPKFSISPSRCSMAQVKPYIGLIYMKNATFSYHQCLWNVRGSSFVSGGHSLGPKCNVSSQTKFNQNWMKNAKVETIRHWSALVGQLGRSKNSRSHLKLILCCSLPDVIPHIKFHQNRMKIIEIQIFEY